MNVPKGTVNGQSFGRYDSSRADERGRLENYDK
jgi:hypothetical protein